MTYTNNHRALLQAIIDRGVVSNDDARELIVKLFQDNRSTESYMNQINVQLERLDMTVENVACEVTGKQYWILVSTLLDDTARKIFSEIVDAVDCSVPSTVCLNLCSTLENKMSKADAEAFLATMVRRKWFVNRHGKFYLGVRSVAELVPYFRATYTNDSLRTCTLCHRVVFHGERCANCQDVLHLLCFANCAQIQNPPKCPSCGHVMETDNINDLEGLLVRTMDFPDNSFYTQERNASVVNGSQRKRKQRRE